MLSRPVHVNYSHRLRAAKNLIDSIRTARDAEMIRRMRILELSIEEKVRLYLPHLAGRKKADEIIRRIWTMEEESSLEWLVEPLKQSVL